MEKQTKTYFIVEIGGADLYFENLQDASELFANIASSKAERVGRLGYGENAYYYKDGKNTPSMKQEVIDIYSTKKSAEFAKHNDGDKEEA